MRVVPVNHGLDLLKSDLVRSPGLHASTIFGDLFKELEPKRYNRPDPMNPVLMMLGSAFEDRFEKILKWNGVEAERLGEFLSPEGVAFSPDLILHDIGKKRPEWFPLGPATRVGEMKLTSMSLAVFPTEATNGLPRKADKFDCQMKLYANWLDLCNGWLVVCSIREPWNPVLGIYDILWTERELLENEQMCTSFARQRGLVPREGAASE